MKRLKQTLGIAVSAVMIGVGLGLPAAEPEAENPVLPAWRIEKAAKPGRSHIGGLPEIPSGWQWPQTPGEEPLGFVAQIDCAEIPGIPADSPLPKQGMLYFFYLEKQGKYLGLESRDREGWRVFYIKTPKDPTPLAAPEGIRPYKPFPIAFRKIDSVPAEPRLPEDERRPQGLHQLLGYPAYLQSNRMEYGCAEVSAPLFGSKPSEWILLLQVDTDLKNTDMQWADSGTLFFWIKKQDLQKSRFDQVWVILESY